jgi:GNAT superfamily N-acetyltransferase
LEVFVLEIEQLDTSNKAHVKRFIEMPFSLYPNTPQWVPPIRIDVATALNRNKHPFYEHSQGDFYLAKRDGQDVGRIAAMVNNHYNEYHGKKRAQFYFFECIDDQEVADALFARAFEWAKARGLDEIIGPKGLGALDGYGILVEGFENRQMMTMMNYNHAYVPKLVEHLGFEKEVDFVSCYFNMKELRIPERIHSIARRAQARGTLQVVRFQTKSDLRSWAARIGKAYNQAFVNNWEYAPLTDREIQFVLDNILMIADPKLIKIISHDNEAVGFLLGFRDVSEALQRSKGKLLPFGIIDLMLEMRRTKWLAVNGAGVLPEFQGRGGNAIMYSELENTARDNGFEHVDMTQVAESAVQMRHDLINLGGKPYKNHRVYRKKL